MRGSAATDAIARRRVVASCVPRAQASQSRSEASLADATRPPPFASAVEVPALVSSAGIQPVTVGRLPETWAAHLRLQCEIIATLTEAHGTRSKGLLLQALLHISASGERTHPGPLDAADCVAAQADPP